MEKCNKCGGEAYQLCGIEMEKYWLCEDCLEEDMDRHILNSVGDDNGSL